MRKKIVTDFFALIFFLISFAIFALISIFAFANLDSLSAYLIFGSSLLIFSFILLLINRLACLIKIHDTYLERNGLFFGFKLCVKFEDIKNVKRICIGRNQFFEIADGVHDPYGLLSSNSSIKIPYNKKGKEFIKQFWHGDIPSLM